MANEFGPGRDRYPAEGGRFWLMTARHDSGDWDYTLRTKGDWPLVGDVPMGIEVARFNPHVMGRYPGLGPAIVDALNATENLSPEGLKSALRSPTHP